MDKIKYVKIRNKTYQVTDLLKGKGLSWAEPTLSLLDENGEVLSSVEIETGKIDTISKNGVNIPIINKNVDIEVPTKVSDLDNDSNFTTKLYVDGEVLRIEEEISTQITAEATLREDADEVLQSNIDAEESARQQAVSTLQNLINTINSKIPAQATAQNQLADKDFVNSSVATNTANYIYKTVGGKKLPFDSLAELEAYSGTLTNNDYAFVKGTDSEGNTTYTRYKYSATEESWAEEYVLNNSSFTAVQWAAINSGITSGDVEYIRALDNYFYSKSEVDTFLAKKVDKVAGKELSTNDYTTPEKTKLANIEEGAEVNVQSDWEQTNSNAKDFIKNKPTLPTKLSDLINDGDGESPFATEDYVSKQASIEKLDNYLYRVTYVELPEETTANFNVGGCSSYVAGGKLYRNLDWDYSEDISFIVNTPNFTGMAFGSLDELNTLPYKVVDGINKYGIKVATHILFNDFDWTGTGDIPLYKLPFIALSTMQNIDDINDLPISELKGVASLGEYVAQYIVTDGTTTYAILPSENGYVIQNITANPKLTNFKWVADEIVSRDMLQNRPTGVERWNLMPCPLNNLRFTKAYESPARLSEFIGINGTTKDSTDLELTAIYEEAREIYLDRARDGQTWQTMHSVVYGDKLEHLYIQENWDKDYATADVPSLDDYATKAWTTENFVEEAPNDTELYGRSAEEWTPAQKRIIDLPEDDNSLIDFKDAVMKKPTATNNNIVLFDSTGDVKDSTKNLSEFIEYADTNAMKHLMDDVLEADKVKILTDNLTENSIASTVDSVLVPSRRYFLGVQTSLSLTLPTNAELGQQIEVVFSSGATACTLTCSLTDFDFVPKANTTNKIVFELIHKADTSVTGDEDVWSVEIKEG